MIERSKTNEVPTSSQSISSLSRSILSSCLTSSDKASGVSPFEI
uniref:Uncharacterized protein n=1 Tax=Vibrio tasmaniensis TaxID=212663 RepID=A0A0H3ZS23_9VIBR|nr:hypothetical protein [Vibrio tasmaniensis]